MLPDSSDVMGRVYKEALMMALLRIIQSGYQEDVYLTEALTVLVHAYTLGYDLDAKFESPVGGPLLYKGEPVTWWVKLQALEDFYPDDPLVLRLKRLGLQ